MVRTFASSTHHALPSSGRPAGYSHLIESLSLTLPSPYERHAVADKQVRIRQDGWMVHPSPRWPGESVVDHLVFALKYEGLNLLVLKRVFEATGPDVLVDALIGKPGSAYLRRLGFLYEWLLGETLPVPDGATGLYVAVVDERLQYAIATPARSRRFRILDNMPGTSRFCPLIARTRTIEFHLGLDLSQKVRHLLSTTPEDILARAAAYLLLADSKASFDIEKEKPSRSRLMRWGDIIGRAGRFPLQIENLVELQREVIGNAKFVHIGLRTEEGFVGTHDHFNQPVPDHIDARAKDVPDLLSGLVDYDAVSAAGDYHPVLAAAALAFGFVYIHPFEDGNGRIHRFLIHHVLAHRGYTPKEIVFPISNAILHDLLTYRTVLETYSKPLLPVIEWVATEKGNVEILNETADFYRYFDATPHAEFLFHCLRRTIEDDLPHELHFLETRDRFHRRATEVVDMPERTIDLLLQFLRQNEGRLSQRARDKEFVRLTPEEIRALEDIYSELIPTSL